MPSFVATSKAKGDTQPVSNKKQMGRKVPRVRLASAFDDAKVVGSGTKSGLLL